MINYGRGLCNLISQMEGHLLPSFIHFQSRRKGLHCTTLDWGEGCVQLPRQLASHPARHGLTFKGGPLPVSGSSFSLGLKYPALLLRSRRAPYASPVPSCRPYPGPKVEGVNGHGGERALCACLLPWPKHCAIWQSEDALAGFQE